MSNLSFKPMYEFEMGGRKFAIQKVNRKIRNEADNFYSSVYTALVTNGIMPKSVLKAKLDNMGGALSDRVIAEHEDNIENLRIKTKQLEDDPENELLQNEISEIKDKLIQYEVNQFSLYQNTAEVKAQDKTIIWLVLNLSYEIIDGQPSPIIKGKNIDQKLDNYDELDENDFIIKVLQRINYLLTLWFLTRISTQEEFERLDKDYQESDN